MSSISAIPSIRPQARKSPDWLESGVIYQIFLRNFTKEGTLKEALGKLPRIKELGVDIVYLSPIFLQDDDPSHEYWSNRQKSFDNPLNPYRIKDFYVMDPEYGTEDDLGAFIGEAHRLGMRVMLDVVFLHCGPRAVFLEEHPDYVKRDETGNMIKGLWNFPDLNFDNPGLREYLLGCLEYWMQAFDVDGYRCDVSDEVPLDFWESARARLEVINPDVIFLAEGKRKEDQLVAFDLNYSFDWTFGINKIFNQGKTAVFLRKIWESMESERPKGARFIRFIDNHDIAHNTAQGLMRGKEQSDESWGYIVDFYGTAQTGILPDSRLEKVWGVDAVEALLALTFTIDGVPFLYNGQEIADAELHNNFGSTPVDWSKGETPEGRHRFAFCQRLCALRHREPALVKGSLSWIANDVPDQLLAFIRDTGSEQILVLVNISAASIRSKDSVLKLSEFRPLLEKGTAVVGENVELEPFSYFIGKRQK